MENIANRCKIKYINIYLLNHTCFHTSRIQPNKTRIIISDNIHCKILRMKNTVTYVPIDNKFLYCGFTHTTRIGRKIFFQSDTYIGSPSFILQVGRYISTRKKKTKTPLQKVVHSKIDGAIRF